MVTVMNVDTHFEPLLLYRELVGAGVLAPLTLGGREEALWSDCDLACLAENRLGDTTDPRALGNALRSRWRERATTERWYGPGEREFDACFWLLDAGERAGTIALARRYFGNPLLRVSSLYVLPSHRGRGVATRVLERLRAVLGRMSRGFRLDTRWTWPSAVRFYLRRGLWVRMWKRDLEFCAHSDAPPPLVRVEDDRAWISADFGGERLLFVEARRRGTTLTFEATTHTDTRAEEIGWYASSTLAVALALRGWPLIRSQEIWDRCYWSDGGAPEALAYNIPIWEAWDRKHGFRVPTPRIPGLAYPSWEELEARWAPSRGGQPG